MAAPWPFTLVILHCARPVGQPALPIALSVSLSHWDEYELCLWFPSQVFASVGCCGKGAQCDRYPTNKRRQFASWGTEYKLSKCMLWKATQRWIPLNSIKWWWCCWVLWKLIALLGAVSRGGEEKNHWVSRLGVFREPFLHIEDRNTIAEFALMWCLSSEAYQNSFPMYFMWDFLWRDEEQAARGFRFVATPCHDARRNMDLV